MKALSLGATRPHAASLRTFRFLHTRWEVFFLAASAIMIVAAALRPISFMIVDSASMEPTLHCALGPGCTKSRADVVLVDQFTYRFRSPQRGDVVVVRAGTSSGALCGGHTFVKRVIGLPGETIGERQGRTVIDGRYLFEPYVPRDEGDHMSFAPRAIPPGHYFVMGDNRRASCDSRVFGFVARRSIVGHVLVVWNSRPRFP